MKKVGILTFHGSHNYGAMLQTYALFKSCEKLNVKCEVIDYRTKQMLEDYSIVKKTRGIKSLLKNLSCLLRYFKLREGYDKFEKFIRENLKLTRRYSTMEELKGNPPQMDVYITGSDQVWNGFASLKDAYFLPFGSGDVRKISFAASMGDYPPRFEYKEQIREYLKQFYAISVREKWVAEYLKDIINDKVRVLCDPVILLEKKEWEELCEGNSDEPPYIFCYFLADVGKAQEIIDTLKQMTGCRTITVSNGRGMKIRCDKVYYNVGPIEFLTYIKNAQFVITNSFHGTALSILLEKSFYSVKREVYSKRILDLLKSFSLEHRYICDKKDIQKLETDFSMVEELRKKQMKQAMEFLAENLK